MKEQHHDSLKIIHFIYFFSLGFSFCIALQKSFHNQVHILEFTFALHFYLSGFPSHTSKTNHRGESNHLKALSEAGNSITFQPGHIHYKCGITPH